jgi:mannose-6-phosphate isomerase-like protein (cupin superfamily)
MKVNIDIEQAARKSTDFRREIVTNKHSQVVLMCVQPGDDIGEEMHSVDQVLVFVEGRGEAHLDGVKSVVQPGSLVAVPAGTRHNFVNTGDTPLKLYTIYSPPEEAPGTLHRTKADAQAAEAATAMH